MGKHIFFMHGRSFKPDIKEIKENWYRAIEYGIQRDFGSQARQQFQNTKKTFIYYGHISNHFLNQIGKNYNKEMDVEDRNTSLNSLTQHSSSDFSESSIYENLPGKSALKEALADAFGGLLFLSGFSEKVISSVAPDMAHYWNRDHKFGSDIRWCLSEPLARALANDDDVLLISHSLGAIVSFDVLWKFSHYGEYHAIRDKKISHWITIGAPLGDETVKNNLKGKDANGIRRFPINIQQWSNVAAEDDFIAYDQKLENDFRLMVEMGILDSITDHKIYNLAIRNGKSNPHHSAGYLISPTMARLISNWI